MNAGRTYLSRLLQPATGYPDAYVSTRLVPRLRALLDNQSSTQPKRKAEEWAHRHQAVVWSYCQISPSKRQQLEPIYLYTELPLLISAIRFKTDGKAERADKLLATSLWSHNVRRIVTTLNPEDTTYTELRGLLALPTPPQDLEEANLHPLNRFERQMFEGLFLSFKYQRRPHLVHEYCAALVDLYNLACVGRHNHMDIRFKPLAGGKLRARDYGSPMLLPRRVTHRYGHTGNAFSSPAQQLRFTMAKRLKQRALSGGCLERICAYLWVNMVYPDQLLQGLITREEGV